MKKFEIITKKRLAPNVNEYVVYAPLVAKHCLAGQFIILRTDEDGERVPFTICDYSREDGTVSILVQEVGYTTMKLTLMQEGECLEDFVGPLGNATDLRGYNNICLIGGGIGSAVIYPQAKQLHSGGKRATVILGARNKDLLTYVEQFDKYSDLHLVTDDGSCGEKGFVTDMLKKLVKDGSEFDCVFAVGPLMMMKFVCKLTKEYDIKTIVSMNPVMIDGTGMCGGCRLSVGGKTKFACVDGPDFDGHEIDFDVAINRGRNYREWEKHKYEETCNLFRKEIK